MTYSKSLLNIKQNTTIVRGLDQTFGRIAQTALSILIFLLQCAPASGLELHSPVDCTLGKTCFVFQLPDRDAGPGQTDFRCQPQSYDTHTGTDFGLPSLRAMRTGVDVLAAASGRVRALRDGMPDVRLSDVGRDAIEGRECGNGLVIDHPGGWSTQYCHLMQDSLAVRVGDMVQVGDILGKVGLSGRTDCPHLHLVVRHLDRLIDPFDGRPVTTDCGATIEDVPLWHEGVVVASEGGALSHGITTSVPAYRAIWELAPHQPILKPDASAIVHWAHFYGLRKGDNIETKLFSPDGSVIAQAEHVLPRPRASEFRAVGLRRPRTGWSAGVYTGTSRLFRGGKLIAEIESRAEVRH